MAWLFELIVQFVVDSIVWPIGAAAGRIMILAASLGRISVARDDRAPASWHGLGRQPDGALAVHGDTAAFIGLLGCAALTLALLLVYARG